MDQPQTIAEYQAGLRAGQFTCRATVQRLLRAINQRDPQVRAWVMVDAPGALARADELDRLAAAGQWAGPLHGVTLGVKDIIDVAGWPTLAGSPLREGHRAEADAPVVAALREAGAIVLGKTVTTQWACFDPAVTRNPWNLAHTPGGSSSGSAAAVACGMCHAALATQTGGSITRPASYCGAAGLKPTWGAVSQVGVVPVSERLDHIGAIAATVADLEAVWEVLRPHGGQDEMNPGPLGQGPRIGVLGGMFRDAASAQVTATVGAAVEMLHSAGAEVSSVDPPASLAQARENHYKIMAHDAARIHAEAFARRPAAFAPKVSGLIRDGLVIAPAEIDKIERSHRPAFRHDVLAVLDRYDVLLAPATPDVAPASLETTGDPAFNAPWSYSGLPVVSLPCGLAGSGLPVCMQLIGRDGADAAVLRFAAWCESVLGFAARPPATRELADH